MKTEPTCPGVFYTSFGRKLVEHLGGDASKIKEDDCWPEFGLNYPELLQPAMQYFENAKTGYPSLAAYLLVQFSKAPLSWGMRVIENAKTGRTSLAAYFLVKHCNAPQEWYDKNFGPKQTQGLEQ